ncbi:MAG TPA: hypothetical protein VF731_11500 [Solirubrobacterales bacterium]
MAHFDRRLLTDVSAAVLAETSDPDLAERVVKRLSSSPARRTGRRNRAKLDPFEAFKEGGENVLRDRLRNLNLEQLKDVVAQYGMDPNRLAMKWKSSERLADHIVGFVKARSQKGSAFKG